MTGGCGAPSALAAATVLLLALAASADEPPPTGAEAAEPTYYIEEDRAETREAGGPYGFDQLVVKLREGLLTPATLAWTQGQADWVRAGEIEALADLFLQPPPLPSRPPPLPAGD